MNSSYKALTTSAILLASVTLAQAATVTFNDSISVIENSTLDGTNVIELSQFDSSLGELTNVTISVTLSVPSFDLLVDNDAGASADVTTQFGTLGNVFFSTSAGTIASGGNTISSDDFAIATQSSDFTVQANDSDSTETFDVDGGNDNGSFTTTAVNTGETAHVILNVPGAVEQFNDYQSATPGSISYEIALDLTTDLNINSGGGGDLTRFQGVIPSATFAAEIIYEYTPVPEASTFAAISGLVALGFVCTRRRK